MNKRIRQLAEQARKHFPKTETSGEFWVFDEEKFAELIVQECVAKCEEVAVGADQISKGKFVTDAGRMLHEGMWGGAKNCAAGIKSHFGVEP